MLLDYAKTTLRRARRATDRALYPVDWDAVYSPPRCTIRQRFDVDGGAAGKLSFEADAAVPLQETIREVIASRFYVPADIETRLPAEPVILDVGANIGVFAIWAGRCFHSRVIAVEPVPDNLCRLRHNLRRNPGHRVEVMEAALTSRAGSVRMRIPDQSVGAHIVKCGEMGDLLVRCMTLGDITKEKHLSRIDLLKMDCEGAEYEILESLTKEQLQSIGSVSMEFHELDDRRNRRRLQKLLESAGFTVKLTPDRHRPTLGLCIAFR